MYRTNFGIGHDIPTILNSHKPPKGKLGDAHNNLYLRQFFIT